MPDRSVKTLQDLIWYQYAKIIAKKACGADAKHSHFGFVKTKLRELQSGKIRWSDILREDRQLVTAEQKCIFCGCPNGLSWEHLVPKSLKINERCSICEVIQSIHNQVLSCRSCNSKKGTMGLYTFYARMFPTDDKSYDKIPPLAEKKYLKTVYECLEKCTPCFNETPEKQPDVYILDETLQRFGRL
jgi:hypothetical protein